MSEDPTIRDRGYVALQNVKVGAADRGGIDAHNRIRVFLDGGHGHLFPRLVPGTVVNDRLHLALLFGLGVYST